MFNEEETRQLLEEYEFPNFELSYETITHNKVLDANLVLAIPEGRKFYAWFTTYKAENACILLEIDLTTRKIISSKIVLTGFKDCLSYNGGTILSGTIFLYENSSKKQGNNQIKIRSNNTCFCIEDIYYYKGNTCETKSFLDRLKLIKEMLCLEISQMALTSNYIIFGLPLINTNFTNLIREIEYLPYTVDKILFRYFNTKKILCVKYYKPNTSNQGSGFGSGSLPGKRQMVTNAVFLVKPDIQNDIYNLYYYKNGKEEYYDIACIQEYTTSVMMNRLFRDIKENKNLDALEESDDESEFQNEKEDKFVFLERSFKMNCVYNPKFKKWTPVSTAKKTDYIVTDKIIS